MTPPLFDLRNVVYRYGTVTALDGLDLTIAPGDRIALLGANGSGKSTLLRILAGLYFPTSGAVAFEGRPLTEARFAGEPFALSFRRRVGLVFQNPDVQLFCATVWEEVAFGPLQLRMERAELERRVEAALHLLGIEHLRDRPPYQLSGGEKKKVAIATVLVLEPEVILLDEPTAALDPHSQTQIIDFLTHWGGGSKTIITATHDLHVLDDIADSCRVFERGRVIASGSPAAILEDRELLRRSNLIHAHRHAPGPQGHAHPGPHGPGDGSGGPQR